jgi:hypothetical protein
MIRRANNPPTLLFGDGLDGVAIAGAGFDFDEHQRMESLGDDVDFARR